MNPMRSRTNAATNQRRADDAPFASPWNKALRGGRAGGDAARPSAFKSKSLQQSSSSRVANACLKVCFLVLTVAVFSRCVDNVLNSLRQQHQHHRSAADSSARYLGDAPHLTEEQHKRGEPKMILPPFNFTAASSSTNTTAAAHDDGADNNRYVALFYNVYVGKESNDQTSGRILRILRDQMDQIGASYAAKSSGNGTLTVYYNTIGSHGGAWTVHDVMTKKLCPKHQLNCVHMRHHEEGFEDTTLQHLYEYCLTRPENDKNKNNDEDSEDEDSEDSEDEQQGNRPEYQVVYVHNKGSFHPRPQQDSWRRHATAAATHEMCLDPNYEDADEENDDDDDYEKETCNVCALLWAPFPSFHAPGNFWSAKCSYIKELIPPSEWQKAVEEFMKASVFPRLQNQKIEMNLYPKQRGRNERGTNRIVHKRIDMSLGLGRYSMEQWIGSHPSIVPCSLSSSPNIMYWQKPEQEEQDGEGRPRGAWQFNRSAMYPRHRIYSAYQQRPRELVRVLRSRSRRYTDFHLLLGQLLKWRRLYETLPAERSWIWRFYPDGSKWRRAVRKHGLRIAKVIDEMKDSISNGHNHHHEDKDKEHHHKDKDEEEEDEDEESDEDREEDDEDENEEDDEDEDEEDDEDEDEEEDGSDSSDSEEEN